MILQASNLDALRAQVATSGQIEGWDLRALNRMVEHVPEDITTTVQAGMTLADFQARLAEHQQWLPVDPPHADTLTIGALLETNASGPRRYGYGTVRDWLIGLAVVLADGRLVRSGGKVVKNVAGFDLGKLFVGSHGALGIIVEATFKLLPRPDREMIFACPCPTLAAAGDLLERICQSDLQPCVLDLYGWPLTMVLGFAGPQSDVAAQATLARDMGFVLETVLDYDRQCSDNDSRCTSVAPADLISTLEKFGDEPFVARAGNGIIYHRNTRTPIRPAPALQERVKKAFDPQGKLPNP